MRESNRLLQLTQAEVVTGQIAIEIKREDWISDLSTFNCHVTTQVEIFCQCVVMQQEIGFTEGIACTLSILTVVECFTLRDSRAQIHDRLLIFTLSKMDLTAKQKHSIDLICH